MKDFINKLELAFDKKLDKTNYGRNQVKELFLRACIEVLADFPSREKGRYVKTWEEDEAELQALSEFNFNNIGNKHAITVSGETVLLKGNPNFPPKAKVLRYNSFAFNDVEDAMFVQYCKAPGYDEYMFEVYGHDMELLVEGWTRIDNPSEDDMMQLYLFYKENLPF